MIATVCYYPYSLCFKVYVLVYAVRLWMLDLHFLVLIGNFISFHSLSQTSLLLRIHYSLELVAVKWSYFQCFVHATLQGTLRDLSKRSQDHPVTPAEQVCACCRVLFLLSWFNFLRTHSSCICILCSNSTDFIILVWKWCCQGLRLQTWYPCTQQSRFFLKWWYLCFNGWALEITFVTEKRPPWLFLASFNPALVLVILQRGL